MALADIPRRRLAGIAKEIRERARETQADATDRHEWEESLLGYGRRVLREAGLVDEAATAWLKKTIHDLTADLVKPAGASPRAAAGQTAAWPEMEPRAGWHALRVYARQQRGVYLRYQLCVRVVAALDLRFSEDMEALDEYPSLAEACVAAGVDAKDIEALAA